MAVCFLIARRKCSCDLFVMDQNENRLVEICFPGIVSHHENFMREREREREKKERERARKRERDREERETEKTERRKRERERTCRRRARGDQMTRCNSAENTTRLPFSSATSLSLFLSFFLFLSFREMHSCVRFSKKALYGVCYQHI